MGNGEEGRGKREEERGESECLPGALPREDPARSGPLPIAHCPISCLLCGRNISPFPPIHPSARGFERALLCRWHFREALDPEWFEVGPRAYWLRIERIAEEIQGAAIQEIWYTEAYFSLLFLLSNEGLLYFYPQNSSALVSYVPSRLKNPGAPRGLPPLTEEGWRSVAGPEDEEAPKPGLAGLIDAKERATPLAGLCFGVDEQKNPDDRRLSLSFLGGSTLALCARGWASIQGSPVDVTDLSLVWSGE